MKSPPTACGKRTRLYNLAFAKQPPSRQGGTFITRGKLYLSSAIKAIFIRTLSLAFIISLISAPVWADTFNLYNGQVTHGKVTDVIGELIRFQSDLGSISRINRIELVNNKDTVITVRGEKIHGEVIYIDPLNIEIVTDKGRRHVLRFLVLKIIFGQPDPGQKKTFFQSPPPIRLMQLLKQKMHPPSD